MLTWNLAETNEAHVEHKREQGGGRAGGVEQGRARGVPEFVAAGPP